jgi:hypothetical protein
VLASSGDQSVRLDWLPVPRAIGYQVYRMNDGHAWLQVSTHPVSGTHFTDHSPGLAKGQLQTYAIAALLRGRDTIAEGPRATVQAAPAAAPAGFAGSSINEGDQSGSVAFDASTGVISLRGCGSGIWDDADGAYFLNRPVSGDFQVTAQMLTGPTLHREAKGGLMVRDSLDPGARNAALVLSMLDRVQYQWRPTRDGKSFKSAIGNASVKLPVLLRLIRRGDSVTAQYSTDGGKQFRAAGRPLRFPKPLPRELYVGLASSSSDNDAIREWHFRGLEIRQHPGGD